MPVGQSAAVHNRRWRESRLDTSLADTRPGTRMNVARTGTALSWSLSRLIGVACADPTSMPSRWARSVSASVSGSAPKPSTKMSAATQSAAPSSSASGLLRSGRLATHCDSSRSRRSAGGSPEPGGRFRPRSPRPHSARLARLNGWQSFAAWRQPGDMLVVHPRSSTFWLLARAAASAAVRCQRTSRSCPRVARSRRGS